MTVTLELSKEETEWIASRPDAGQTIHDMIRSHIEDERRLAARRRDTARSIVRNAKTGAEKLKAAGMTHEQAADRCLSLIFKINARQPNA